MQVNALRAFIVGAGLVVAVVSTNATAVELVQNGGFEVNGGTNTSTFSGWTVVNQASGSGNFYVQTGTTSPTGTTSTVPAPPQGAFAAMTSQTGPGSHIIYQDIAIPAGATATFSARVFVGNSASSFATPTSLDYTVSPNQQARIDIIDPAAPVTDVGTGVLLNLFQTRVGDPANPSYTSIAANVSQFAGRTVRLRIAEVDNLSNLLLAVDAVSVEAQLNIPVLDGRALLVLALLLAGISAIALRRRASNL